MVGRASVLHLTLEAELEKVLERVAAAKAVLELIHGAFHVCVCVSLVARMFTAYCSVV